MFGQVVGGLIVTALYALFALWRAGTASARPHAVAVAESIASATFGRARQVADRTLLHADRVETSRCRLESCLPLTYVFSGHHCGGR
jgi:hypothetical protein